MLEVRNLGVWFGDDQVVAVDALDLERTVAVHLVVALSDEVRVPVRVPERRRHRRSRP